MVTKGLQIPSNWKLSKQVKGTWYYRFEILLSNFLIQTQLKCEVLDF